MAATHTCPYPGCETQVDQRHLACRPHWYALSKATRDRVWDTYLNGRDDGSHTAAVADAIHEMRRHAAKVASR